MVKKCVAGICQAQSGNRKSPRNRGRTSVFKFPDETDKARRQIWIKYVENTRWSKNRRNRFQKWKPGDSPYLCSLHFKESEFIGGKNQLDNFLSGESTRLLLTKNAVPNVKYEIPNIDTRFKKVIKLFKTINILLVL